MAPGAALLPLLAGCGQTGPLYLPEDEGATVITRPGPAAGATAPASTPSPASTPTPAPAGEDAAAEDETDNRKRR